jgi:hypothetical protein
MAKKVTFPSSGAGPLAVAIAESVHDSIVEAMTHTFRDIGLSCCYWILLIDTGDSIRLDQVRLD